MIFISKNIYPKFCAGSFGHGGIKNAESWGNFSKTGKYFLGKNIARGNDSNPWMIQKLSCFHEHIF
jgi:hypothetical protein